MLTLTHSLAIDDLREAAAKLGSRLDGQTTAWSPDLQRELQDRYAAMLAQ